MERAELATKLGAWRSKEVGGVIPNGPRRVKDNGPYQLISEPEAQKFMAAFADAAAGDAEIFLCDPHWGDAEKRELAALLESPPAPPNPNPAPHSSSEFGWLMLPTGGSGGQAKFARHDQHTLAAAVSGFTKYFGLKRVNAMGVLPLHHVSGFMAWMRCTLTGGEYRHLDWKAIEHGTFPELPARPDGWVISLVPTQLERLLRQPMAAKWLAKFRIVFLGGAPAGSRLLDRAATACLPLSPGYGMTETAAMVTALRPEEFLAGARSSGWALPHAQVRLTPEGTIVVMGRSVFRGYYPGWLAEQTFVTHDAGRFDARGDLVVMGRQDGIIITGGEKVNPAEVEAVMHDQGGLTDVVVVGLPDAEWGQVVVAAYSAKYRPDIVKLNQVINSHLLPYKRPKYLKALARWPLTSAGKVNRAEVARRLLAESADRGYPLLDSTPGP